ncbi:MAG: tRNA (adenine(22)-N(1))-methyltransferase [Candidatus Izemoplasmatales bacterium]|jgi:tRNA (adenine22-N1)-methyltransferase
MIKLSPRLEAALGYLPGFSVLIDIGTDHAKLPIVAVSRGYVERAVAVDNKTAPLRNAQKNIDACGLGEKIKTILAEGFPLGEYFDVATILGLGGLTIKTILEKADLSLAKRLVLAPHSDAYSVRNWLMANRYRIVDETFLIDRRKNYQIIVAESGEMDLDELELEFGPVITKKKEPAFKHHLEKLILIYDKAKTEATDPMKREALEKRVAVLKGMII